MATQELISLSCITCSTILCISSNSFKEVSTSYSTYENASYFSHPGLEQVEQKRPGAPNSQLEGCVVCPLRCKECKAAVGVKCVEAPNSKRGKLM